MKTSSDRTADTALPYRRRNSATAHAGKPSGCLSLRSRLDTTGGRRLQAPRGRRRGRPASRATHLRTGHHAIRTRVGVAASALDLACRLEPDGLAGSESGGLQDVEIDPRACTVGLADRPQDIAPVGQARLAVVGHHASFDT
jgi:hypothetical protein